MGEVTVSVGGVLTELIVILLGVPLAAPPLGKTGKLPEEIIASAPALIAPTMPFAVLAPIVNGRLFGPPSC